MSILKKIAQNLRPVSTDSLFSGHYVEWRAKRIAAIIEHYGANFFLGKTVLEVGCGHADIGGVFSKLGAAVTCSDARAEHLKIVRRRLPDVTTILADLDQEWPFKFHDLVIHMGVLYHLKEHTSSLKHACNGCRHLVLETEVADTNDPTFVLSTDESGFDQAKNGVGIRPSAEAIESVLINCGMKFTRITDARCNSGMHRYDWTVTNTNKWEHGLRRFWFAEKLPPS